MKGLHEAHYNKRTRKIIILVTHKEFPNSKQTSASDRRVRRWSVELLKFYAFMHARMRTQKPTCAYALWVDYCHNNFNFLHVERECTALDVREHLR